MTGAELIAAERARQVTSEGWTSEHDDEYTGYELPQAANSYLLAAIHVQDITDAISSLRQNPPGGLWPWLREYWKPSEDPIRNLVKAGALIAAEIDRLQRLPTE